jgi:adenylate cyclase
MAATEDPRSQLPSPNEAADARWHALLTGDATGAPALVTLRRLFRHLPSDPRCKLCYAPYAPPFGPVVGLLGFGRWAKNPSLCGACLRIMERDQGGAEVELSMLFADLRGSTPLAAEMSASAYRHLLNEFYAIGWQAVEERGGSIDKYLGDGIFALFIPGFAGPRHAAQAIEAGRRILRDTERIRLPDGVTPLPVGIGIHTGTAYVGVVGRMGDLTDFTALGDAVNVTERLSSAASARELLVSDAAIVGLPQGGFARRDLQLKGVAQSMTAWAEPAAQA